MNPNFEAILQDCLKRMRSGQSLGDCLAAYPEHAEKLRPLLLSTIFEYILEDCLRRMRAGQSMEDCLAAYPNQAESLQPLLVAATDVGSVPVPRPSPQAMRAGRERMLIAAERLRSPAKAKPTQPTSGWLERMVLAVEQLRGPAKIRPQPTLDYQPNRYPVMRLVTLGLVIILLISLGAGGAITVKASEGSLPGEPLYGVKRAWEQFCLTISPNPKDLQQQYSEERHQEIQQLVEQGREVEIEIEGIVEAFQPNQLKIRDLAQVVQITGKTEIKEIPTVGQRVAVKAQVQSDGQLIASQVTVIPGPESTGVPIANTTSATSPGGMPSTMMPGGTPSTVMPGGTPSTVMPDGTPSIVTPGDTPLTVTPSDTPTPTRTVTPSPTPTIPPVPTLLSPASGSTVANSTPAFDWGDVAGAMEYQIQVDDNADWSSPVISTNTSTSTYTPTTTLANGTYYWHVRANCGTWGSYSDNWTVTVNVMGGMLGAGYYEETDSNLAYSGTWLSWPGGGASGDSTQYTNDPAATISFQINGAGLRLYRSMESNRGPMKVCIDGSDDAHCVIVTNYSETRLLIQPWPWTKTVLNAGVHSVIISNTSTQYISLDAVEVLALPPLLGVGYYEDTDSNLAYNGAWLTWIGTIVSGGSSRHTNDPAATISFQINGAGLRLYRSMQNNRGPIKVCIDGSDDAHCVTVANYSETRLLIQPWQWTKTVLSAGIHSVTISNTSTLYIDLDAVEVLP